MQIRRFERLRQMRGVKIIGAKIIRLLSGGEV
jgi:hypothetical protein